MTSTTKPPDDAQLQQAADRSVDLNTFKPPVASDEECELRRQLCEFMHRRCRQRLLISTEGSFSARRDDDSFLITPTLKDRELLRNDDLVLVSDGKREAGKKASRAVLAHRAIYKQHPDVKSIVFAHPARSIGEVSVMPEPVITELKAAFNL